MQYSKPHLSFDEQANLLIQRGLIVRDKSRLIEALQQVSYYRLSAYWLPFREMDDEGNRTDFFQKGITFERVWDHYRFDRRLRVLLVDAIERIEIALRTQLVYLYTKQHGPFDYVNPANFPSCSSYEEKLRRIEIQAEIKDGACLSKCRHQCIIHFFRKYGDCHDHIPFWMFAEISDFGFTSVFYSNSEKDIQKDIANQWGLTLEVLDSWLRSLNTLRNTCAHHGRLWNNIWGTPPKLPGWHDQRHWYAQYDQQKNQWILPRQKTYTLSFTRNRTATLLIICRYLLKKVAPRSEWHLRLMQLFSDFSSSGIDFSSMGFSNNEWMRHPIWKD